MALAPQQQQQSIPRQQQQISQQQPLQQQSLQQQALQQQPSQQPPSQQPPSQQPPSQQQQSTSNEKRRVKVYELRNNDWFDRGTGFCTGTTINDEHKVLVESEDLPERMLLDTRITKDDGYQKQQETLIVWTASNGTDMALSFQEADGCAAIWEFVHRVQQHLSSIGGPDDALSDDAMDNSFPSPILPPDPDLGNLGDVDQTMRQASSTPQGRDALARFIIGESYIRKLVPLVDMAEDLEALVELHRLSNIMKILILLNDTHIIEQVVSDDLVLGVVGALEYDQDFPHHKANHRQYLKDPSRFKEVVPIDDEHIRRKIHATWRLQYLKDVVLARILDDPTFSVLNSLIFFNQVDIVTHLQGNPTFLNDLFGLIDHPESDARKRKDAICFLQQCCAIAKNLQAHIRATLYENFVHHGLLSVLTYALTDQDTATRVAGTDMVLSMIDHDPVMVRGYIARAIKEGRPPLTDTLITLLLVEPDLGVKAHAVDALRMLLDAQNHPLVQVGPGNPEMMAKMRAANQANHVVETFIANFYNSGAKKMFGPLIELEHRASVADLSFHDISLLSHLVDMLVCFTRLHPHRCKTFLKSERLIARVGQLLACPQKHMKLMALRFFRSCLGCQEEFYYDELIANQIFEPIITLVYETMPRDNLLNSACLELFEFLKRESIKRVIIHLATEHRARLEGITYVDLFSHLLLRHEQMKKYADDLNGGLFHEERETLGLNPRQRLLNGANSRWQGVREMDTAEEDYFNTSDDDDEVATAAHATGPLPQKAPPLLPSMPNGHSPLSRPLVDYPDDDEDSDLSESELHAKLTEIRPHVESTESEAPVQATTTSPTTHVPLERLKEKRRRDEDDDDELSKLTVFSKRRSSISSGGSERSLAASKDGSTGGGSGFLSRKRSFSRKDSNKVTFTLAVKAGDGKKSDHGA